MMLGNRVYKTLAVLLGIVLTAAVIGVVSTKTFADENQETPVRNYTINKVWLDGGNQKRPGSARVRLSGAVKFSYSDKKKVQKFTAPVTGSYTLRLWGARGGNAGEEAVGGDGGYTEGTIDLKAGEVLYVAVGGKGEDAADADGDKVLNGGWNGGGAAKGSSDGDTVWGSGGGATHIAIGTNEGELRNYLETQEKVLLVAGGGGGAGYKFEGENVGSNDGGAGGGYFGVKGISTCGENGAVGGQSEDMPVHAERFPGSFGAGGDGTAWTEGVTGGAGGGSGWYGGDGGFSFGSAGSGGSGYINKDAGITGGKMINGNGIEATEENADEESEIPSRGDKTETDNGYAVISFEGTAVTKEDKIAFDVSDEAETEITGSEEPVPGYFSDSAKADSIRLNNDNHKATVTNILQTRFSVNCVWDDNNNAEGMRPEHVTVQLFRNGETAGNPVTLSEGNRWKYTWTGLNKYSADGKEYKYTVKETGIPNGYSAKIVGGTITNFFDSTTTLTVNSVWEDNDNNDGIRPNSILVQLFKNGEEAGKPVTITEDDQWEYTWDKLKTFENGEPIVYTIEELNVPDGYEARISGNTITNVHEKMLTSYTATVNWYDFDNNDGIRPRSVLLQLKKGSRKVGDAVKVTGKGNSWKYTWDDLDEYNNQSRIKYHVEEVNIPEAYEAKVKNNVVTNKHAKDTTSYTITQVWNDKSNQDSIRPSSSSIVLKANGQSTGDSVTLTGNGDMWTHTWSNLDKYNKGKEIKYSADQEYIPEGYTLTRDEEVITNTHKPKVWSAILPKTGDDTTIEYYLIVLMGAIFGLILCTGSKRKQMR